MTTHTPTEWALVLAASTGATAAVLTPGWLLVEAEHLVPQAVRQAPAAARAAAARAALSAAALLLILTAPAGGTR